MSGMSAPGGGRKPLGAGWITFIAVDVILIVAVLIVAIVLFAGNRRGSDPSVATGPTSSSAPTDQESPEPTESEPTDPEPTDPEATDSETTSTADEATTVASPSGNIVCTIIEDSASCSIADLAKEPEKDESCDGTVGYVYSVTTSGVETPCVGERPAKAGSDVAVLDYGQTVTAFGFTCSSAETGMGCSNGSGNGFVLARAGAQVN